MSSSVIQTSTDNDVLHVSVEVARFDAAVAREFKAGVETVWRPGIGRVEVDLVKVDFVDSSGIGALITVHRKLSAGEGRVALRRVRQNIRSMLELLRLSDYFEITG